MVAVGRWGKPNLVKYFGPRLHFCVCVFVLIVKNVSHIEIVSGPYLASQVYFCSKNNKKALLAEEWIAHASSSHWDPAQQGTETRSVTQKRVLQLFIDYLVYVFSLVIGTNNQICLDKCIIPYCSFNVFVRFR